MDKQLQENKSFLGLVKEYTVRIPLIQRDYAQGRTDKQTEEIRENFLEEMLSVLTTETESPLVLDFIYGSSSVDKVFTPLDGQQRLTTLFLLHWYLCSQEDISLLRTENGDAKFTYETRSTSKDFCNNLVNHSFPEIKERIENIKNDLYAKDESENKEESKKEITTWTLSKGIKNESWFAWAWRKDPTIAGMLVMLDAMDEKLNDKKRSELWQKLKDENNIVFHLLPLEQFNLSDDLFVKMNARGKELSDFDKYKSTLEEQMLKNNVSEKNREEWQSQENSLWMDLFWNTFYSELKEAMPDDEKEQKKIVENIEERYRVFLQRMKEFQLSDKEKYPFEFVLEVMKAIIYIDDNKKTKEGSSLISTVLWDVKDTLFNDFIDKDTYLSGVMFFAVLQFFKYFKAEKVSKDDTLRKELNDWMRIIRNLAYNTPYNNSDDYEKALKSLENLALAIYEEQNSTVFVYFANDGKVDMFSRNQCDEEKIKADLFINDYSGKWKEEIIKIENHAYFSGQIGFILEFSKIDNKYDIDLFSSYSEKLGELFGDDFQDKYDCLFQRALLTFGDYLVDISGYKTFCTFANNLRAKTDNWRRVFNDNDKVLILKQLLDEVDIITLKDNLYNKIKPDFQETNNAWKSLFINNNGIIKSCSNYQIAFLGTKVALSRSFATSWRKHAELYSYTFFKLKLEDKISHFTPFQRADYWNSSDYEPCAFMEGWNYNNCNFVIDIRHINNQFLLTFFDRNKQEVPNEIVEKIENCGFTRQKRSVSDSDTLEDANIWECTIAEDFDFDMVENKIKEVICNF
jgi:hypothetical protein